MTQFQALQILRLLEAYYPQAQTALQYNSIFELLLAVMLSAQTTDRQVNAVTAVLFPLIREGPQAVRAMGPEHLEKLIRSCGIYRQKSRQIIKTCGILVEKYGGEVPGNRKDLISLPGVGRKTANIILCTAFGIPAFAVDTHVMRVSRRLGLAVSEKLSGIEAELCALLPPASWMGTHHRLIAHGRRICRARKPQCAGCFLADFCLFYTEKQAYPQDQASNKNKEV